MNKEQKRQQNKTATRRTIRGERLIALQETIQERYNIQPEDAARFWKLIDLRAQLIRELERLVDPLDQPDDSPAEGLDGPEGSF